MAEEIKPVAEEKRQKIPIDAKLLSDAVIELNISRRSVGLYPREHPIIKESIERAFGLLEKLFELRESITLGIAKDTLIIDDNILDKKNPVFNEFALALHGKGIAAISFRSGLLLDELVCLHEIIVSREAATGKEVAEMAGKRGLTHVLLTPLDISKFGFVEDRLREDGGDAEIWENYVSGLIEGTLADDDAEGLILNTSPEEIALLMNERLPAAAQGETYDRVITSYLKRKDNSSVRTELFNRFLSLVDNLSPELKQQFLRRTFHNASMDHAEAERLLTELSAADVEKIMSLFKNNRSMIPESVSNLLDKLQKTKAEGGFFDRVSNKGALIDDIEIDDNILRLFEGDHFSSFVGKDYKQELERMTRGAGTSSAAVLRGIDEQCTDEVLEKRLSELLLELLDADDLTREDYLAFLTAISEMATEFLETGRFAEVSEIYNTVYSQALTGKFRDEARSMIDYFFRSDGFIDKFIDATKLWGRHNREGVFRLLNVQRLSFIDRLLQTLAEEPDPSIRKFLLQLLSSMGNDVAKEAAKRLDDSNWYVVRNMIYLLREAGGVRYLKHVRRFAKDKNRKICVEALRTLLHFKSREAISYIKLYLQSDDLDLRGEVIKLAGMYRCAETVPLLLDIIKKMDVFGTDAYYKIPVVRTLGDIGDPQAIEGLVKIMKSKTVLYRAALGDLKVEIFRNLKNYPPGSTFPLLVMGINSKNEEIRTISEKLLRERGPENVPDKNL